MVSAADRTLLIILKKIFRFCLFLLFFGEANSQEISFTHFTAEQGLSHNAVMSIAQDSRGFMWYGTTNGLNRFDGHSFRIYRSNNSDSTTIHHNDVKSLLLDSKNTLWIGTIGGLSKYVPEKDAFYRIPGSVSTSGEITCMYEDKNGSVWVGTINGLFQLTDREENMFRTLPEPIAGGLAGKNIRALCVDHQKDLWIGTTTGLTRLKSGNGFWQSENFHFDSGNNKALSADYITAITEDANHNIWIGTQNNGINLYDPSTNSFKHIKHSSKSDSLVNNNIRKIMADRSGRLWIGTQEGLSVMDPDGKTVHSYQHIAGDKTSLSQNSIYSLYQDRDGSVWVGTYFGGVNIFYSKTTSFKVLQSKEGRSGLSNNVVSAIVEDEKRNLWIGTEGGGLNYYDRQKNSYTIYKNKTEDPGSLASNLIKVVYRDKQGNIWIGTHGGGLNLFNESDKTFKRFLYKENDLATLNGEVLSVLEDRSGKFWVGTNSGLKVYKKEGSALMPLLTMRIDEPLSKILVKNIIQDSKDRIWLATWQGAFVFEKDSFRLVGPRHNVNFVTEDKNGNIWAGINYGGFCMYDLDNDKYKTYTEKDGLPGKNVVSLLEDEKSDFWLGTDNGLVRFDQKRNLFQLYTSSDGIAGNEFNYNSFLKDSRGEFFFGGFDGITSFFPAQIEKNNQKAPVVLTGLSLFNEPISIDRKEKILNTDISLAKSISLRYDQNVFTIDFALLNYIKSNKHKYAYKLDGFDKNWNEVFSTSATYTNLPAGKYTFLVKGANNDGVWSDTASLAIRILPPWWRTWAAYCIYALIAVSILFLLIRYFFLRALLKKEDELHQVKLNFFTNISHEIRTHLTLIMAPVERMQDTNHDEYTKQQLSSVRNNANRLLRLVSELMDFRKAETNNLALHIGRYDLIPFLEDIYSNFRDLSLAKNIRITYIHDSEHVYAYFDREQLEKVFFNLLTNAFKFTPESGTIVLAIEQKNDKLIISVTDNGRGIAQEYMDKLFNNFFQVADHDFQNTGYGIGLALTKHIVELHKGKIEVESEPATKDKEGYTRFTVSLLTGNKHFEQLLKQNGLVETKKEKKAEELPAVITTTVTDDKQLSILVVEDNPEVLSLIRETFSSRYNVLESADGSKGWELAIEQIPDLIISDVMMPVMDGFTLCTRLKTDERTSHIPVILLTAKTSQSDQVAGLETGADLYITKPFSTKLLELNARNLLASREKMRLRFSNQINEKTIADQNNIGIRNDIENLVPEYTPGIVDREFLDKLIQLTEEHMSDTGFGVDMLARKVNMSQPVLYKKLKAVTNMSVNDFIKSLRLQKAAGLLREQRYTVYEVTYAVGYNDRKYFSREFKKQFGKTPTEFAGMKHSN